MRLTKRNPETGQYEYKEKAKTLAEFKAQRKAVIQRLGEFEDKASDLAEKIFAEIEEIIDKHYNNHIFGNNDLDDLEHDAIINFSDDVTCDIAKLKKKYTEVAKRREVSENNTVRCFHPSVTESQREAERREDIEKSPVDCSTPSVTDLKGDTE